MSEINSEDPTNDLGSREDSACDSGSSEDSKSDSNSRKDSTNNLFNEMLSTAKERNSHSKMVFEAIEEGKWNSVQEILNPYSESVLIADNGHIILWFALQQNQVDVAKKLLAMGVKVVEPHPLSPLFYAAFFGHTDIVTVLLEKGVDINGIEDRLGQTPLHGAVMSKNFEMMKLLLKLGASVNKQIKCNEKISYRTSNEFLEIISVKSIYSSLRAGVNGWAPLHMASALGYTNFAEELLKSGADIDLTSTSKKTPLWLAFQMGREETIILLLNHGADVKACAPINNDSVENERVQLVRQLIEMNNEPDPIKIIGHTPLYFACKKGNDELVHLLISKGEDVNAGANFNDTPLHAATEANHTNTVRMLLEHGADIEATREYDGSTALHVACLQGNYEILQLLLNKGADINVKAGDDETPLHIAVENGDINIITDLLGRGAEVDSKRLEDGYKALHIACCRQYDEIVRLLINKEADVNAQAENNLTPLHTATYYGNVIISTELLDHGAELRSKTLVDGYTALHTACEGNHDNMVRLLISKGADVNARAENNVTPLHIATHNGSVNIITDLLELGAELDSKRLDDGYTALHIACHREYDNIVRLLISKGADVNAKAENNVTPLDIATHNRSVNIITDLFELDSKNSFRHSLQA